MKKIAQNFCIFVLSFSLSIFPVSFAAEPDAQTPADESSASSNSITATVEPAPDLSAASATAEANAKDQNKPVVTTLEDISQSTWLQIMNTEKAHLSLVAGRSHIMKFSKKVTRISVSNPEVLDFVIVSPTEVLLNAKQEGSINVIVWDDLDEISVFDINVTKDPSLLMDLLKKVDPKGKFEVYPSHDVFVVKGETDTAEKAKEVEKAANAFAEGSVSLVEVKEAKQILLQIRFVEMDHTQDYDFGVDLESTTDNPRNNIFQRFLPGNTTAANVTDSTTTLVTPAKTITGLLGHNATDMFQIFIDRNNRDSFNAFVKAIETKGIVKTIARPNLLAKDGEEASFLVGGEAAILVSTNDQLQVQYKEFGTKLTFTPQIIGDGKIRLSVAPEVSALNAANGVTSGNSTIPGFSTTRAKTLVELRDGETLVIGGLLQQKKTTSNSGVPFLSRIPYIGKLFQSVNEDWRATELIVIVTPAIIYPEKDPLKEGSEKHDILSVATQMMPNGIVDENSEAIKSYFKDNKRYQSQSPIEKTANPVIEIKSGLELKKLDDLEAKLR